MREWRDALRLRQRRAARRRGRRWWLAGAADAAAVPRDRRIPQHMNAELSILLGKEKTVLEIRDFLSGEFEPVPLEDVLAVLKAREAAGIDQARPRRAPQPVKRNEVIIEGW